MNTNNYILMGDLGYDGQNLLGIYSELELAKEAIMDFEDREDYESFKTIQAPFDQPAFPINWASADDENCRVSIWEINDEGNLEQIL